MPGHGSKPGWKPWHVRLAGAFLITESNAQARRPCHNFQMAAALDAACFAARLRYVIHCNAQFSNAAIGQYYFTWFADGCLRLR